MVAAKKFSKVSPMVILHGKLSSDLTVENFATNQLLTILFAALAAAGYGCAPIIAGCWVCYLSLVDFLKRLLAPTFPIKSNYKQTFENFARTQSRLGRNCSRRQLVTS